MEAEKRAALIGRIRGLEGSADTMPVVSLEAFFEGNDDPGSIGCNLPNHPGPHRFYELLAAIRARREVQDVLVGIYEIVEDDSSWPFAETVYVLTSAAPEVVRQWAAELEPDEVEAGFPNGEPPGAPVLAQGMTPVRLWWD
jgi:hypothetical protein